MRRDPAYRSAATAITLAIGLLASLPAVAQTQTATASIGASVVEANERVEYRVDATSDGAQIQLAEQPDFGKLNITGRQQMPSMVSINGVVEQRLTLVYALTTDSPGTYTIEPPTFRIGKANVRANPVTLRVVEQGKTPTPTKSRDSRFMVDAVLDPNNRKPYVGEQLTLSYYLFVSQHATPTHAREPALDAFWIEELTDRLPRNDRTVTIDGRSYRRSPMWSFAIFPLRPGPVEIEPATVDLASVELFQRNRRIATISSDAISLDVQPLPEGAPLGFSEGNVGSWTFNVKADRDGAQVGKPFTVELTVTGNGQVGRVKVPTLPPIEHTRVSDVDTSTSSTPRGTTVGGTATTKYSLVPLQQGKFTIPAMTFHWFDPTAGAYRTSHSDPIVVDVADGVLPADRPKPVARVMTADEDLIANLGEQLRPRRDAPDLTPARDPADFPWAYYLLTLAAFITFLGFAFGARLRALLQRAAPQREQRNRAEEAIEAVEQATDAVALARALTAGLHNAWGIPRGAVTSAELTRAFEQRDLNPDAAAALTEVLAECEVARFAPTGAKLSAKTKSRAIDALRSIAVVLAALLAVAVPMDAFAQDEQIADVQFNIGTDAAIAGDYGVARLALERAAYLAPSDADIETNRSLVERIVRLQIIERSRTGRTPEGDEVLFWWRVAARVNPHVLGVATILFWLLAAGAVYRRRRTTSPALRDSLAVGIGIVLLLAAVSTFAMFARAQVLRSATPIVVLSDQLDLREGPNAAAKRMRTPPTVVAGTMLRIEDERGEWVKISWNTDSGWTRRENVGDVVPR